MLIICSRYLQIVYYFMFSKEEEIGETEHTGDSFREDFIAHEVRVIHLLCNLLPLSLT